VQSESKSTPIPRDALSFILFTAFLNLMGIGIIAPVLPFIAARYVAPQDVAPVTSLLFTAYSFFTFIAVPTLGALSDRYGRRPILLICLFGSAVGYLIFGIGGALWVLFLGRIIDGITGGNFSTILSYIADLTEPKDRTKYFGMIGAVSGFGFVVGPVIGGILSRISYEAPVYFAAGVTLANVVWGYFRMPESLPPDRRAEKIPAAKMNPFTQLVDVFRITHIRWLLVSIFLFALPFALLQANVTVFSRDALGWDSDAAGVYLAVIGIVGIIVQGGLVRQLQLRMNETRIVSIGYMVQIIAYLMIALVASVQSSALLLASALFVALGNGLATPPLNGLTSQSVGSREQGRVQGGSAALQSLARVIGPIVGGVLYSRIGIASPYVGGAVILVLALLALLAAIPSLMKDRHSYASGE
jgi:MFS transporter, DHA1 family, tetracycline resistance protein